MKKLHTAAFEIRNVKRSRVVADGELASKIIREGPLSLRRFEVNGIKWEVGVVASATPFVLADGLLPPPCRDRG